ncbi:hypothetical protein H2O64_11230 [Kordia sp. YSTF-M3]|uniref:Bacteriocin n=1 Tax=Kordia aestuariivivens TaxID=2759037 RepID=A0ABR7Q9K4_9FLAO|nr:hypothetical protein [Kordia aestuariivivens]MBC8755249.1 hypothetical protein [Kordia aestuariivivens]
MRKKTLKNLALNKKVISNLKNITSIEGGRKNHSVLTDIGFICEPAAPQPLPQEPIPASDPAICTGGFGDCPINL